MENGQPQNIAAPNSTPEANWKFNPAEQLPDPQQQDTSKQEATATTQPVSDLSSIKWTASEFIAHDKGAGWYLGLALGTVVLAAAVYLLSRHDIISTVVVVIVAIIFGVFAARKPRELQYVIDSKGVKIGDKFYPYSGFRSFSVVQEEAVESIWFMPLKRFMPPITIYFEPENRQSVLATLSQFLPAENKKLDVVDKLMHRVRF